MYSVGGIRYTMQIHQTKDLFQLQTELVDMKVDMAVSSERRVMDVGSQHAGLVSDHHDALAPDDQATG